MYKEIEERMLFKASECVFWGEGGLEVAPSRRSLAGLLQGNVTEQKVRRHSPASCPLCQKLHTILGIPCKSLNKEIEVHKEDDKDIEERNAETDACPILNNQLLFQTHQGQR